MLIDAMAELSPSDFLVINWLPNFPRIARSNLSAVLSDIYRAFDKSSSQMHFIALFVKTLAVEDISLRVANLFLQL